MADGFSPWRMMRCSRKYSTIKGIAMNTNASTTADRIQSV